MRGLRLLWPSLLLALVLVMAPATVLAAPGYGQETHVVQPGETLSAIAQRYGVGVEALMRANGLVDPSLIRAGQQLVIPDQSLTIAAQAGAEHVVQPGETLYGIAARYGISALALARANTIANPALIQNQQRLVIPLAAARAGVGRVTVPGPAGVPGSEGGEVYVVQAGDTLAAIATRTGRSVAAIASANRLSDPGQLRVGQQLAIPGDDAAALEPGLPGLSMTVSISQQRCQVYQDDELLYDWACSTGRPGSGTRTGTFYVQSKVREAWGSTWGFTMPYWLGIYWSGNVENGIHGLPYEPGGQPIWGDAVGTPVTFGCVLLGANESRTLWSIASIGMPVTIAY